VDSVSIVFGVAALVEKESQTFSDEVFFSIIEAAVDPSDVASRRYFRCKRVRIVVRNSDPRPGEKPTGETTVRLRNRKDLPRWARTLRRMMRTLAETQISQNGGSIYERVIEPTVGYAHEELRAKLKRHRLDECPVITTSFEKQLRRLLIEVTERCADSHFAAFKAASYSLSLTQLQHGPDNLEDAFLQNYGQRIIALFRSYPGLARVWSELIEQWVQKIAELTIRVRSDRKLIMRNFFGGLDPGVLKGVRFDLSDPHRGGRETVILYFEHSSIVYKPRSGQNENAWFSLLRWINRHGFSPAFRTLRILCRRRYCWAEFVAPTPCRNVADARNYYRRAGGLLCITYLIGAIDCHCDNLIAAGDQPILIDAETLLHREPNSSAYRGPAALLRTGLLPLPEPDNLGTCEVSGLGGITMGSHTPMLQGKILPLSAYRGELAEGFRRMWNLIGKPHTTISTAFDRQICQMRGLRWRRVYYPTSRYAEVREASLQPSAFRSGTARWQAIETQLRRNGTSNSIIHREIRSIVRLDVPYFTDRAIANSRIAASDSLSALLSWIHSARF
jgi:lantibiotic modifying enzyme